jgi:hypothetical protein
MRQFVRNVMFLVVIVLGYRKNGTLLFFHAVRDAATSFLAS